MQKRTLDLLGHGISICLGSMLIVTTGHFAILALGLEPSTRIADVSWSTRVWFLLGLSALAGLCYFVSYQLVRIMAAFYGRAKARVRPRDSQSR